MTRSDRSILSALTLALALAATFFALSLSVAPSGAQAQVSAYCGNHLLPGWQYGNNRCDGARRNLYAVYGWGDNGAVCVGASLHPGWGSLIGQTCSGGPGAGTFTSGMRGDWVPFITNSLQYNNNRVHGVAYQ